MHTTPKASDGQRHTSSTTSKTNKVCPRNSVAVPQGTPIRQPRLSSDELTTNDTAQLVSGVAPSTVCANKGHDSNGDEVEKRSHDKITSAMNVSGFNSSWAAGWGKCSWAWGSGSWSSRGTDWGAWSDDQQHGSWEKVTSWVHRPEHKSTFSGATSTWSTKEAWTWTTNSWWSQFHHEGSRWAQRRVARAIAFNTKVSKGETPERPMLSGPERANQACKGCDGRSHYALRCSRQLCGACCKQDPDGACSWHQSSAALMV